MLTPTRRSFQEHVWFNQNPRNLPLFGLPQNSWKQANNYEPKEALSLLDKSTAGFVGKNTAYLVSTIVSKTL